MERTESRPFGRAAERKRKNLIKLGVMKWMAYAWSRTRIEGLPKNAPTNNLKIH